MDIIRIKLKALNELLEEELKKKDKDYKLIEYYLEEITYLENNI